MYPATPGDDYYYCAHLPDEGPDAQEVNFAQGSSAGKRPFYVDSTCETPWCVAFIVDSKLN